ncbi:hypothetical protein [Azospirillum sp. TSO22-1]|uniref:hypothetical protein n=1 Tax=Azospirillum sp. TSO22-1 TaxID=716789 RepID=UPI000D606704|nr:hypothetical protein [Azospirillum sp. TSO22-1]PWC40866.1 hypothetical protein TSO221_24545 [Azospirillum sp. TSO22-1]
MTTRAIMTLALLALAACASPEAELAKQAPQTMVGMPKGTLLSCAGVPQRSATAPDGTEYLSYGRQQTNVHRDLDWEADGWIPGLWRPEVSTWTTNYSCEATFAVRRGRVAELRYNADRDIQLCYQLIGGCLGPAR